MVKLKYYEWIYHLKKAQEKKADSFFIKNEEFLVKDVENNILEFISINKFNKVYVIVDGVREPVTIYNVGFEMIPRGYIKRGQ